MLTFCACRQMKMRPGEVLVDRLESIEDTKVSFKKTSSFCSRYLYLLRETLETEAVFL